MKIGRWSLVVASIVLLAPFANAEKVDLKLACKVSERILRDSVSREERTEYITFTNNMSSVSYSRLNVKCEKLTKTDDYYLCNSELETYPTFYKMELDRRSLKVTGTVFDETQRIDFEGACKIANTPKI
jgi:hypothetical protein